MKRNIGKHETGPEKFSKREFQRDPALSRDLAREWGMEAAPESYRKALEHMYVELPDELPVRRYPLRSALRGLTVAAAVLVLVCASLLGVNAVNPQLTESLPGIGQVFRAVNGTEEQRLPENPPTAVVSLPEESGLAEMDAAEFVPVRAQGKEGTALTVLDAWSDGGYLHLELLLQLECGEIDLQKCGEIGLYSDPQTRIDTSFVEIDGNLAEKQNAFFVKREDTGEYDASWVMKLPKELTEKQDIEVHLSVPDLSIAYLVEEDQVDDHHISSGLDLTFSVTADPKDNVKIVEAVTDNGVTLVSVDSTPTRLLAELEIPFLGRVNYSLLEQQTEAMSLVEGGDKYPGNPNPLGVYGVLRDADGQWLEADLSCISEEERFDFTVVDPLGEERPYHGVDEFGGPPRGTKQVVLTLYEYPLDVDGMAPGATGSELLGNNRVAAEFTIDLERGIAYPSQNYLDDGLEKLNAETCGQETQTVDSPSGYYPTRPYTCYGYGPVSICEQVIFYTENKEYRPVELRCYSGEDLVQVLKSRPEAEYNYPGEDGTNFTRYEDEHGQYWESFTDPRYTQKEYRQLNFVAYYPEETARDEYGFLANAFDRMDLVDSETGEVLIQNEARTFWRNYDQKFGTAWETGIYEGYPASQEGYEAKSHQGESSAVDLPADPPIPEPSPQPTPQP